MLNMNAALWPQMPASSAEAQQATDIWGLGSMIETQARLWNHMLDANRSLWEAYLPWLAAGPSLWTAAYPPLAVAEAAEAIEAAAQAAPAAGNGAAAAAQAQAWGPWLDASRTFWSAFGGWPAALAGAAAGNGAAPEEGEPARAPSARRSARSGRPR